MQVRSSSCHGYLSPNEAAAATKALSFLHFVDLTKQRARGMHVAAIEY
jgi:hypothetical protein